MVVENNVLSGARINQESEKISEAVEGSAYSDENSDLLKLKSIKELIEFLEIWMLERSTENAYITSDLRIILHELYQYKICNKAAIKEILSNHHKVIKSLKSDIKNIVSDAINEAQIFKQGKRLKGCS